MSQSEILEPFQSLMNNNTGREESSRTKEYYSKLMDQVGDEQNKKRLLEMMEKDDLDVGKLVDEFDGLLERNRILNVYVYGSRLYGKSCGEVYQVNRESDYDLLVIYDFEEEPQNLLFITNQKDNYCTETFDVLLPSYLRRQNSKTCEKNFVNTDNNLVSSSDNVEWTNISKTIVKKKNLKTGDLTYELRKQSKFDLDISLYSKNQFQSQLKKNKFNELLALFLENNVEYQRFIIQQSFKLSEEFPNSAKIDCKGIAGSFCPFSEMVWNFCQSLFEHKWGWDPPEVDIFKAKKRVIHTLRIYHYALQIAKHGCIVDWHVCDPYFDDIFESNEKYSDWNEIYTVYDPIRIALRNRLEKVYNDSI